MPGPLWASVAVLRAQLLRGRQQVGNVHARPREVEARRGRRNGEAGDDPPPVPNRDGETAHTRQELLVVLRVATATDAGQLALQRWTVHDRARRLRRQRERPEQLLARGRRRVGEQELAVGRAVQRDAAARLE